MECRPLYSLLIAFPCPGHLVDILWARVATTSRPHEPASPDALVADPLTDFAMSDTSHPHPRPAARFSLPLATQEPHNNVATQGVSRLPYNVADWRGWRVRLVLAARWDRQWLKLIEACIMEMALIARPGCSSIVFDLAPSHISGSAMDTIACIHTF